MEVPKVDHMLFFSTFRLCNDQARQAERAIINIQKGVFQTAECGFYTHIPQFESRMASEAALQG